MKRRGFWTSWLVCWDRMRPRHVAMPLIEFLKKQEIAADGKNDTPIAAESAFWESVDNEPAGHY